MKKLLLSTIAIGCILSSNVFAEGTTSTSKGFVKSIELSGGTTKVEDFERENTFGAKLRTNCFLTDSLTPSLEVSKTADLYSFKLNGEYELIKVNEEIGFYTDGTINYLDNNEADFNATNFLIGAGVKTGVHMAYKPELKLGARYGISTESEIDSVTEVYAELSAELLKNIRTGVSFSKETFELEEIDEDSTTLKLTVAYEF